MEPFRGICFTCGAYLGRRHGRQCGPCLAERTGGSGCATNPMNTDTDSAKQGYTVIPLPTKSEEEDHD